MSKANSIARELLFWLAVVIAAIVPLGLAVLNIDEPPWWMLVASGMIVMIATKFDVVEELSIGPLKAKLREQIHRTELTMAHLRQLIIPLAKATATITMAEGRWGGGTRMSDRHRLKKDLDGALEQLGVSEQEKGEIYETWNKLHEFDHAARIGRNSKLNRDLITKLQALNDFDSRRVAPAKEYEQVIRDAGAMTPAISEEIADLEHFQRTKTLRRPSEWT